MKQMCLSLFISFVGGLLPTLQAAVPTAPSTLTIAANGVVRLEAENFDLGGAGVAYNLQDKSNAGVYRIDGFNLEATSDIGGGYNLGWTVAGN